MSKRANLPSRRGRPTNFTARERKFVRKVVELDEVGKAAIAAGFANRQYGSKLIKKPHIREAILQAMEKRGIDDSYIAQKIKEGLEATYPKKFSSNGSLMQDNEPDYFTRGQYLDKVLRVAGAYSPEQHEVHKETQIVITFTPDLVKGLIDAEVIDAEIIKEELPQLISGEKQNAENSEHPDTDI